MSGRGDDSISSQEAEFEARAELTESKCSSGSRARGRSVIYDDDDYVPRRPWRCSRLEEDDSDDVSDPPLGRCEVKIHKRSQGRTSQRESQGPGESRSVLSRGGGGRGQDEGAGRRERAHSQEGRSSGRVGVMRAGRSSARPQEREGVHPLPGSNGQGWSRKGSRGPFMDQEWRDRGGDSSSKLKPRRRAYDPAQGEGWANYENTVDRGDSREKKGISIA